MNSTNYSFAIARTTRSAWARGRALLMLGLSLLLVPTLLLAVTPFEWQQGPFGLVNGGSNLIAYGNGRIVTLQTAWDTGTALALSSDDGGATWQSNAIYTDGLRFPDRLAFVNGEFVLLTQKSGAIGTYRSADGLTWESYTLSGNGIVNSIAYGNGRYVAVGGGGGSRNIHTSENGTTWTRHDAGTITYLHHVTFGNGVFVHHRQTSDGSPQMFYSTDGVAWSAATVNGVTVPFNIEAITWGDGVFVAVGQYSSTQVGVPSDVVLRSADGQTWTRATGFDVESGSLKHVVHGDGVFLIPAQQPEGPFVPGQGNAPGKTLMYYSQDGETWVEQILEATRSPNQAVFAEGRWLVLLSGEEPLLLTSGTFGGSSSTAMPSFQQGKVVIPSVEVDGVYFSAELALVPGSNPFEFTLSKATALTGFSGSASVTFSGDIAHFPSVSVDGRIYEARLRLISPNPMRFVLASAKEL